MTEIARREVVVDGLRTAFIEAGDGEPLVLLHGGEFGAGAELAWERVIGPLARGRRVIAPDLLGYGGTAKVLDFEDGRAMRLRHLAALCRTLGLAEADFIGNSMGAVMLLHDATADRPLLPVRRAVLICGGGTIQKNEHVDALYDYDGSFEAMRALVRALFHGEEYPKDDAYVARRHRSSLLPGAWEAVAAARFRRPGAPGGIGGEPAARSRPRPERIRVPVLFVEGEKDKLLPRGWAAELAAAVAGGRAATVPGAGHCPQIEQPERTVALLADFLGLDRN
ncbi:alpha/beta fold hydrolase [Actinomadura livida]|uniref:Alpha/beta fold hydrolase n=1 Tax=Actinomadura livida TaxID=79909 RepID=A0A7W7IFU2_9ACTN|nr:MULTISPECIES: alpha/beta hydrolase [Actinomadura]MBB4775923.1 pimeloyl-ACP methyl ester carboxylesterase [Actinomadura catellatispora]GGU16742.1 alpha/beta hydrolase [Actinomadura livida]